MLFCSRWCGYQYVIFKVENICAKAQLAQQQIERKQGAETPGVNVVISFVTLQGGHVLTPLPAATPLKPGSAVSSNLSPNALC